MSFVETFKYTADWNSAFQSETENMFILILKPIEEYQKNAKGVGLSWATRLSSV